MFDFSTLITNRSASDLENLRALLSTPMEDWTAEQLAEFNLARSKGAYNYTDLNRVTQCMEYLDETLRSYGYETGYQKIEVPHKAESGGLPAVTEYRYLRMTITAIRGSGSIVQLSEIKLEDSDNGLDFTWPVTTTVTSSIQAVSNEPAQNLIDGSTSTKFCSTAFSSGATLTIDLGEGNHVDLGLYNTWQWYTANDAPERDPISFSLDVSNDGTHWLSVDSVSDASITETRKALAYSGSITLPTFTRVAYIESSGTEYIDTGSFVAGPEVPPEPEPEPLDPYTWYETDVPTQSQLAQYLNNVLTIWDTIMGDPTLPETMVNLTQEGANQIEAALIEINTAIEQIIAAMARSNSFTFWSGNRPFPTAYSNRGRTWAELDAMGTSWRNWQVATWYLLLYGNLEAEGDVT